MLAEVCSQSLNGFGGKFEKDILRDDPLSGALFMDQVQLGHQNDGITLSIQRRSRKSALKNAVNLGGQIGIFQRLLKVIMIRKARFCNALK